MIIRDASVEDIKQIQNMLLGADAVAKYGHPYEDKDILSFIESPHWLSVIEDEGDIIAVMLCYDMAAWGYVDLLYVRESRRRHGCATKLLDYIYQEGPPRWTTIEVCVGDDITAKALISKNGFKWKAPVTWAIKER